MLPRSPKANGADGRLAYLEVAGEPRLAASARLSAPDGGDNLLRQNGVRVTATARACVNAALEAVGMFAIFASRNVFQILHPRIGFVVVDVVDNRPLWTRAEKCGRNEYVHLPREFPAAYLKADLWVSICAAAYAVAHDLLRRYFANAAKIRDFVIRRFDNQFPNFHLQPPLVARDVEHGRHHGRCFSGATLAMQCGILSCPA